MSKNYIYKISVKSWRKLQESYVFHSYENYLLTERMIFNYFLKIDQNSIDLKLIKNIFRNSYYLFNRRFIWEFNFEKLEFKTWVKKKRNSE